MSDAICGFQGEYRWLSNFWPCRLTDSAGRAWPSVEHAYQALKYPPDHPQREVIRLAPSPAAAKRLGRAPGMRPDWNDVKLAAMLKLLRLKFAAGSELAARLLATGDGELVEVNGWGDTYWGVCRGRGFNHLGRLLMQVRDELRKETT